MSDPESSDPVVSDPVVSDPVASEPVAMGQFVTRDEFSRLESRLEATLHSKFDEMLQLMRRQTESSAPTSISSHGSGADVSETLEQLKARSPAIAAYFKKDNKHSEKTGEADENVQTCVKEPADSSSTNVTNIADEETRVKSLSSHTTVEDQVKLLSENMKELENRLCDRFNISLQQMSEFQTEMRELMTTATSSQVDLQTMVKQQTRNLEDIRDQTGHLSNQLNTVIEETHKMRQSSEDMKQSNNVLSQDIQKHSETITQSVDKSNEHIVQTIQASISSVHGKLDQSINDVTTKLNDSITASEKQVIDEMQRVGKNVEEVQRTVESHGLKVEKNIDGIQKEVENHGEKIKDSLRASIKQHSQNTGKRVVTKLENSMRCLQYNIFKFTEKECQLVRDGIEGPLPSHKTYTLDLFVKDFKELISSDTGIYSPPWHINQFKSSLQGNVTFVTNGKLDVWMLYGRRPRLVGLQARHCGKLKVKATITDSRGQLPDLLVGEMTDTFNEDEIEGNSDWGFPLGEIDCQDIVNGGYADIDQYCDDSVLVRYTVDILEDEEEVD